MKKLVLIIVVFAALGAVVWIGLQSKPASGELATVVTPGEAASSTAPEQTGKTPRVFRHRDRANADGTNVMDVWDRQIDAVLASNGADAEIADKLLALYPQVPTNGQADLILEIAPRVSNENYSKLSNIMTNSTSPGEVIDVLLNDLLERPASMHLPMLLEVARSKENPKSPDAHDLLEVILGDDYGEDWDQWSKKISEWIASHPE